MELVRPSEPEQQEKIGGGGAGDTFVIHPHCYPHSTLKTATKGAVRKQLEKLIASDLSKTDGKEAQAYVQSLDTARGALNTALASASVSEQAVLDAAAAYLALLLGLVTGSGKPAADTSSKLAGSPDDALAAAETGSGPPPATPTSKLRGAARFEWTEVVVGAQPGAPPRTAAHADALLELASVLAALAIRLMHAAAAATADSASGVPTPASTRGYQLLRQAAGILDFVAHTVALPPGMAADTDVQVLRALSSLALADAQQLTMLRAVAKGNAASLIASLAVDTAELYSQACSQLTSSQVAEARMCKLWHYGQYKQAYCLAYAHCFNGIAQWKQHDKCGAGLKSLEAAAIHLAAAKKAAAAYDAAPPSSLNMNHRRVDEELDRIVADTQRRMKRENDSVYLQPLAPEAPPLPEGKRLIGALPYALPAAAPAVKEGVVERCFTAAPAPAAPMSAPTPVTMHSGAPHGAVAAAAGTTDPAAGKGGEPAGGQGEAQGCSCGRLVVVILCFPILALLWVLGAIIWVLLLPLKCCCPCCGFPLQWAADLVLWLMRAPARGLLWATGNDKADAGKDKNKK